MEICIWATTVAIIAAEEGVSFDFGAWGVCGCGMLYWISNVYFAAYKPNWTGLLGCVILNIYMPCQLVTQSITTEHATVCANKVCCNLVLNMRKSNPTHHVVGIIN